MEQIAKISYKKTKQIGVGQGMNSTVYLADESQLGGVVAVKEIPKSQLVNSFGEFFEEAKAMFASRHPHVVPIQYACQTPETVCLVMPYFRRGSLTDRIKEAPLSLVEVLRVGQGILSGLSRIHADGRIHFDVKPSNVLFSDSDTPMVADFGQARRIEPTGTATMPPMYRFGMPPEALETGVCSVHSDVYQAGLTLYRAVNGDKVFTDQRPADAELLYQEIRSGRFPDRDTFLPHVTTKIRRAIRKSLRIDPSDRFASAPDFADALARIGVPLNWITRNLPEGEIEWNARRNGRPSLRVRLLRDVARWRFEIHTKSGTKLRAKDKGKWQRGMTRKQAIKSLKNWFDAAAVI